MEDYVYIITFILGFALVLKILMALHIENQFKKNHVWEIKVGYFIFSLMGAHLLAEFVSKLVTMF